MTEKFVPCVDCNDNVYYLVGKTGRHAMFFEGVGPLCTKCLGKRGSMWMMHQGFGKANVEEESMEKETKKPVEGDLVKLLAVVADVGAKSAEFGVWLQDTLDEFNDRVEVCYALPTETDLRAFFHKVGAVQGSCLTTLGAAAELNSIAHQLVSPLAKSAMVQRSGKEQEDGEPSNEEGE